MVARLVEYLVALRVALMVFSKAELMVAGMAA